METLNSFSARRVPWNKGRLTGQKPPLKLREIWAIRTRLRCHPTFASWRCSTWQLLRPAISGFQRRCLSRYQRG